MTITLQQSHDDLAHALVQFADQIQRGHHNPTLMQWLEVASALRGAVAHISPEAVGPLPAWLTAVADIIDNAAKKELKPLSKVE